jgi:hypothetical protein
MAVAGLDDDVLHDALLSAEIPLRAIYFAYQGNLM